MEFVKVYTPSTIDELMELHRTKDQNTYILAGGTDLIIKLNKKEKKFFYNLIDISGIKELKPIKQDEDNIYIGSMATFTEISENKVIKNYAYCLKKAAENVGSTQIRNAATIGGNIANLSPAADSIPALLSLGAQIKIFQGEETKIIKLNEYINSSYKDSCILEIIIPKRKNTISNFEKLGSRKQVTISKVNMAATIELEGQAIKQATIAIGAISKIAVISTKLSQALNDKKLDEGMKKEFIDIASQEVENLTRGRASSEYKKEAVKGLCEDMFNNLIIQYKDKVIL